VSSFGASRLKNFNHIPDETRAKQKKEADKKAIEEAKKLSNLATSRGGKKKPPVKGASVKTKASATSQSSKQKPAASTKSSKASGKQAAKPPTPVDLPPIEIESEIEVEQPPPVSDIERIRAAMAQRRKNDENINLVSNKILGVAAATNNEIERIRIEGTANKIVADSIANVSKAIGEDIRKMEQTDRRESAYELILGTITRAIDLKREYQEVNAASEKEIVTEKTYQKFEEFKKGVEDRWEVINQARRAKRIAKRQEQLDEERQITEIYDDLIADDENQIAHFVRDILDTHTTALQAAAESVDRIMQITPDEMNNLGDLNMSSQLVINYIQDVTPKVLEAQTNNDPNLPSIVQNVALGLNESIKLANSMDEKVCENMDKTEALLEAAAIQDERNETLGEVAALALSIAEDIGNHPSLMDYKPSDPRVRKYYGIDNEHLDVDNMDTEFDEGVVDDEQFLTKIRTQREAEKDRVHRRMTTTFQQAAEIDENLDDLELLDVLSTSIEALDQAQQELEIGLENAETPEEQDMIQEALDNTIYEKAKAKENYKKVVVELQLKQQEEREAEDSDV
jgi:hypothetical protein